jgi:uncharacterized protein (UPF0276 family)
LENLAFAFSMEDVSRQGDFLEQLLSGVDGFLLLDLHNIYCQIVNFDLDAEKLLRSYPLSRVREMHISGGSWSPSVSGKRTAVRRDTHDDSVPPEVFDLLKLALSMCPETEFVFLERLADTMPESDDQEAFRQDYRRLHSLVSEPANA